jgi:hypothetical protein
MVLPSMPDAQREERAAHNTVVDRPGLDRDRADDPRRIGGVELDDMHAESTSHGRGAGKHHFHRVGQPRGKSLWAGHGQRCGSSPELAVQYELGYPTEVVDVHMRHEHGGDRVGIDPLPRQRNEAGRAAVEQDTCVGSADRWIQACNRPPLPIASPGPANVTVTLAVSPSLI